MWNKIIIVTIVIGVLTAAVQDPLLTLAICVTLIVLNEISK